METFTIIGARGYIGSRLSRSLRDAGADVHAVDRYDPEAMADRALGHVVFAAGVTADFRARPFDTVEAHVSAVSQVLQQATFQSFLYLSSTRVYLGAASTREDENLIVRPGDPQHLYNASKIAGEALCLVQPNEAVRVARLSNVYGADDPSGNFLIDVLRAAVTEGRIHLRTSPESAKDFVSIADIVSLIPRIARSARHRIYNLASGRNTRYAEIVDALARRTGCTVSTEPGSPVVSFSEIDIRRVSDEFSFVPAHLTDEIAGLAEALAKQRA
ncbi:MAG: SDR family oxidoreductase [Pseudomonadota bacterium]